MTTTSDERIVRVVVAGHQKHSNFSSKARQSVISFGKEKSRTASSFLFFERVMMCIEYEIKRRNLWTHLGAFFLECSNRHFTRHLRQHFTRVLLTKRTSTKLHSTKSTREWKALSECCTRAWCIFSRRCSSKEASKLEAMFSSFIREKRYSFMCTRLRRWWWYCRTIDGV